MSDPTRLHRYTYQDYLDFEEASNTRHEFLDGEVYGMAGGTPEHAALSVAVSSAFRVQLRGTECRAYSSDLRVRVLTTGLTTYPDVTVVCGPTELDPASPTTVVNPRVVVEVLSDSTEDYDRNEKLEHYRKIPSLAAVVLVSHRARSLEAWHRSGETWRSEIVGPGELVQLAAIDCALAVDEIYEGLL